MGSKNRNKRNKRGKSKPAHIATIQIDKKNESSLQKKEATFVAIEEEKVVASDIEEVIVEEQSTSDFVKNDNEKDSDIVVVDTPKKNSTPKPSLKSHFTKILGLIKKDDKVTKELENANDKIKTSSNETENNVFNVEMNDDIEIDEVDIEEVAAEAPANVDTQNKIDVKIISDSKEMVLEFKPDEEKVDSSESNPEQVNDLFSNSSQILNEKLASYLEFAHELENNELNVEEKIGNSNVKCGHVPGEPTTVNYKETKGTKVDILSDPTVLIEDEVKTNIDSQFAFSNVAIKEDGKIYTQKVEPVNIQENDVLDDVIASDNNDVKTESNIEELYDNDIFLIDEILEMNPVIQTIEEKMNDASVKSEFIPIAPENITYIPTVGVKYDVLNNPINSISEEEKNILDAKFAFSTIAIKEDGKEYILPKVETVEEETKVETIDEETKVETIEEESKVETISDITIDNESINTNNISTNGTKYIEPEYKKLINKKEEKISVASSVLDLEFKEEENKNNLFKFLVSKVSYLEEMIDGIKDKETPVVEEINNTTDIKVNVIEPIRATNFDAQYAKNSIRPIELVYSDGTIAVGNDKITEVPKKEVVEENSLNLSNFNSVYEDFAELTIEEKFANSNVTSSFEVKSPNTVEFTPITTEKYDVVNNPTNSKTSEELSVIDSKFAYSNVSIVEPGKTYIQPPVESTFEDKLASDTVKSDFAIKEPNTINYVPNAEENQVSSIGTVNIIPEEQLKNIDMQFAESTVSIESKDVTNNNTTNTIDNNEIDVVIETFEEKLENATVKSNYKINEPKTISFIPEMGQNSEVESIKAFELPKQEIEKIDAKFASSNVAIKSNLVNENIENTVIQPTTSHKENIELEFTEVKEENIFKKLISRIPLFSTKEEIVEEEKFEDIQVVEVEEISVTKYDEVYSENTVRPVTLEYTDGSIEIGNNEITKVQAIANEEKQTNDVFVESNVKVTGTTREPQYVTYNEASNESYEIVSNPIENIPESVVNQIDSEFQKSNVSLNSDNSGINVVNTNSGENNISSKVVKKAESYVEKAVQVTQTIEITDEVVVVEKTPAFIPVDEEKVVVDETPEVETIEEIVVVDETPEVETIEETVVVEEEVTEHNELIDTIDGSDDDVLIEVIREVSLGKSKFAKHFESTLDPVFAKANRKEIKAQTYEFVLHEMKILAKQVNNDVNLLRLEIDRLNTELDESKENITTLDGLYKKQLDRTRHEHERRKQFEFQADALMEKLMAKEKELQQKQLLIEAMNSKINKGAIK